MSFSDDYASPATPFSGGEAGGGFDTSDMITQSPETTERVVDTQSGFLVVIKRLESRLSLSVKRRIGTPPSSSVLLTPDESVKLSKILSSPGNESRDWESRIRRSAMSSDIDSFLSTFESEGKSQASRSSSVTRSILDDLDEYNSLDQYDHDYQELQEEPLSESQTRWDKFILDDAPPELRKRRSRRARASMPDFSALLKLLPRVPGKSAALLAIGLIAVLAVSAIIAGVNGQKSVNTHAPLPPSPLEEEKVDKFARTFVSNMLDFSPSTYRSSQVQAMSVMTPELLDRYWQETNFPLSRRQLTTLPQGQTVLITRVQQERNDETTKDVDIYAELVSNDGKLSSPVHLKLKVANGQDGRLEVVEQKDLTAADND